MLSAPVAKLANAADLKSAEEILAGSSPARSTQFLSYATQYGTAVIGSNFILSLKGSMADRPLNQTV